MPGPTKRTRNSSHDVEEDAPVPPSPTPTATSSLSATPTRRRGARSTNSPTPTRPIVTRSSATSRPPANSLTRSSSLFTVSTRRSANSDGSFLSPALPGPSGRGGTLVRTQSTPAVPSMALIKASVATGGGGGRGKGDSDPFGDIYKSGYGKGKENIPPRKDSAPSDTSSRKRLRVGAGRSGSTRGRSMSVSSMRSEVTAAPSSSASFSRYPSRLPSPSPSPSSATSSFDASSMATSADPLDLISRDDRSMDIGKTPTKPKARQATRRAAFPTPPPSSPVDEVEATVKRIALVRVKSDMTSVSEQTEVTEESEEEVEEVEEVEEDAPMVGPYKRLKSFLRLSASDGEVIGREDEKQALRAYLRSTGGQDVGLYVSGPPGTGKTATVTSLGRELETEAWRVVELGCMGLKAGDMWSRIGDALHCEETEAGVVASLNSLNQPILLILDEIDSLMPPSSAQAPAAVSHLLSRLFSLPSSCSGQVKLIAISNTLDLTLRARLALPGGATPIVVPFRAYAAAEMVHIVNARVESAATSRLEEGVKIDSKAVELLTKKVEAQNGDLRMCLSVLSTAVSLAEVEWNKKVMMHSDTSIETITVPLIKISIAHIIKAFNAFTQQLKAAAGSSTTSNSTSITAKKIRSVQLQGKMVLASMLVFLARARAGLPGCPTTASGSMSPPSPTKTSATEVMTTANLYATYAHLLSHQTSPYPPSSESDYRDLLSNLEVLGLITVMTGLSAMPRSSSNMSGRAKGAGQKLALCVREEELREGLGLHDVSPKSKGPAEVEVAKIWERESARVERFKAKTASDRNKEDAEL